MPARPAGARREAGRARDPDALCEVFARCWSDEVIPDRRPAAAAARRLAAEAIDSAAICWLTSSTDRGNPRRSTSAPRSAVTPDREDASSSRLARARPAFTRSGPVRHPPSDENVLRSRGQPARPRVAFVEPAAGWRGPAVSTAADAGQEPTIGVSIKAGSCRNRKQEMHWMLRILSKAERVCQDSAGDQDKNA